MIKFFIDKTPDAYDYISNCLTIKGMITIIRWTITIKRED